jgi:hypothetical protein
MVILRSALAFALGYLVVFAILSRLPTVVLYPTEDNLDRIYKDEVGTCYRYEREGCPCP